MNAGKTEFNFLWFIENYSYSAQDFSWIVSPNFTPEMLEGTSWHLGLCPKHLRSKKVESIFLRRCFEDAGPSKFPLMFDISLFKAGGSILYSEECKHTFGKKDKRGFKAFVDMDELYAGKDTDFLPKDTLGMRCRMWRGEGNVQRITQCSARTRIVIENIGFALNIQNASAYLMKDRSTVNFGSTSQIGSIFSIVLCINREGHPEGSVDVYCAPSDGSHRIRRRELGVFDVYGNVAKCGWIDYRFDDWNVKTTEMHKLFTKQFLLKYKSELLPNDLLKLVCEYTLTTSEECKIEESEHEVPISTYNDRDFTTHGESASKVEELEEQSSLWNKSSYKDLMNSYREKLSANPTGLDDFKALYTDQLLTDVELKTATKSFPAHKSVLCARSSVFRSMLAQDLKDRRTDSIQVEDMENETVDRLLRFLYYDSLEDLHWESAQKLYHAANKYDVQKLKTLCSSFLVDQLNIYNVSDLLLLAEVHCDKELTELVEDFILEHDSEIFSSEEWIKFSQKNPQSAVKAFQLKYTREIGK